MKSFILKKQRNQMLVGRTVQSEGATLPSWKCLMEKSKNLIEEVSKSNLDKKMRGPGWHRWD